MTEKNPKRIGGRGGEVVTPLTIAEQLVKASEREMKEQGGSYLAPRENADILPERTQLQAPNINDRLSDIPSNCSRGAGDLNAETGLPAGYTKDERGRIRPLTARDYARMEREKRNGK